ncbi:PTS system D-glucosamine-specific IIC component [Mycoplasmopsis mustelae]|uniref:PTS system D-glucosamine-specific IIC component n=1 Tax=Mycoplasmopsis mustelae TaxID=171289 RepID=A0A4R7UCH8_9BACT|nr:PTS glucose transporter subunit IIA [Mycoplasmopsis mustelae]TDV24069.1 PTS system D-glucosamine-specific IIC component [Mycoplasmopsis mustelae]
MKQTCDKCKPFLGCVCNQEVPSNIKDLIDAFGGATNLKNLNNSVSQLRYDVNDLKLVSEELLKKCGAKNVAIFNESNHIQVELEKNAEELNFEVKKYLQLLQRQPINTNTKQTSIKNNLESTETNETIDVLAPVSGKLIDLKTLNDGIFSANLVGNGVAIQMDKSAKSINIIAPFDGKIQMMTAAKNQFIYHSDCGLEVVILVGLDADKLSGIGFETINKINTELKAGETLLNLNMEKIVAANLDIHLIICSIDDAKFQILQKPNSTISQGEKIFSLTK